MRHFDINANKTVHRKLIEIKVQMKLTASLNYVDCKSIFLSQSLGSSWLVIFLNRLVISPVDEEMRVLSQKTYSLTSSWCSNLQKHKLIVLNFFDSCYAKF